MDDSQKVREANEDLANEVQTFHTQLLQSKNEIKLLKEAAKLTKTETEKVLLEKDRLSVEKTESNSKENELKSKILELTKSLEAMAKEKESLGRSHEVESVTIQTKHEREISEERRDRRQMDKEFSRKLAEL